MRLVAFEHAGAARLGLVEGDSVIDLAEAAPDLPRDLTGLIRAGAAAFAAAGQAARTARPGARHALAGLRFLPPIAKPGKIICLGLNYADHAKEGGHAKPEYPSFFMRCATSLLAHGEAMLRPQASSQLDYEAELVAIVGRTARHVAKERAFDYIAGYSCFNDGSVRDYQRKTSQWTIGKNFDKTGGFGPWFVTADELPLGAVGLTIESRLNGHVMQHANTRDMIVPVAETVALLTECLTLEPGDLLVMGTPAGVGHARKPPVWMKEGDTIEIEIEKIGVLSNPIKDEVPAR
ncbi:MAG TPA: fumarylacetoacetate hydrolase family protein [Stellaceae bacterium]|jgi:2-keto-4-pentenoate hydratase/2-oxohepta-3-ene-1,7-dioic acid hydratase in catechol pathway|nr:fumarylacetoacetate hydrolase family protein [Stellaceae bacterium]